MTETPDYHPLFLQGVAFFNECEFFEAHEVWEDLWTDTQGDDRRFYQGLIQVAVCLHHFGNENTRGAVKLYHSCRNYLNDYGSHHLGVNLDQLMSQLEECCREILESDEQFPQAKIDPERIPEIHLNPPPAVE